MLMLTQVGSLIRPAYACGCGAMVTDGESWLGVERETSAVVWDGRTEQIVMSLTVNGTAPEAAWIMPVPHRATARLGDRALFTELRRVTAPVRRTRHHFWPREGDWPFDRHDGTAAAPGGAAGASAPPVGVVGRERLGPFEVARLTATDPHALSGWLEDNGFELSDRLAEGLEPYVREKWEYVAVRLVPAEGQGGGGSSSSAGRPTLGGELDPLHLTFASDRLVYPMRLSRLAKTPQFLELFVLAPHRMEARGAIGGRPPAVTWAGRLDAGKSGPGAGERGPGVGETPLRELASGRTTFLTATTQRFPEPRDIAGDHELRRADRDTPYRTVVWNGELLTVGGVPAWMATVGAGLLLAPAAFVAVAVSRARRRSAGRGAPAS
ncbi:DUF2330 domain-containing protein [Streptomyces sp. NPDC047108]|uniref:DUF2330 domain-containing protein n=1 Tax=Streptomyces sp. NPDC047108 TaxID=3155025 RepID=UPI0033F50172